MRSVPFGFRRQTRAERTFTEEVLRVSDNRRKNTHCRRRNRALERIRRSASQSVAASVDNGEQLQHVLLNRAAAVHAKRLAQTLSEETGTRGVEYQKAFFERLLQQPVLADVLPDFVKNRQELELCGVVCNGLAQAWSGLKVWDW